MKSHKPILILILSFVLNYGFAQPTMDADAVPEIGMVFPAAYYVGELDMGENGPNREWIFEANPNTETIFANYHIISPAEAPNNELFPDAEMVLWIDDIQVYNFLKVEDNELLSIGFTLGDDSYGITYTTLPDGETNGIWPLTYGDTFVSETMYETYLLGFKSGMGTRKRTATVDSYGTVTTQYGTFEDVLKLSIRFEDSPNEIDQIIFLHPTSFLPLVTYDIANFDGLNPGYFFLDLSELTTSIKKNETKDFRVSVDQQRISIIHNDESEYSAIELFDMAGNSVSTSIDKSNNLTLLEPHQELTTGMYILRIVAEGKPASIKLFIP